MMAPVTAVEQTIASFVLHALWQIPLLAGATALAVRVGRPGARLAHALWSATLLLCVLLPASATVSAKRAADAAARDSMQITYSASDYAGPLAAMHRKSALRRIFDQHVSAQGGLRPFAFALNATAARCVTLAYLLVCLAFGARLAVGWVRTQRLVKNAVPLARSSAIQAALERQCSAMNVHEPFAGISEDIHGPALAGAWRPTLLLPACAEEMSREEIEAVLAHELSHLRRKDPPLHMACALLTVPVGFHPAALWVAKRVRQTREMACDAEAAAQMRSVHDYARALLQVAERAGADAGAVGVGLFGTMGLFNTGLGLFANSFERASGALEERMQMMMGNSTQTGKRSVVRWAMCAGVCGVAIAAASMVQVQPAHAQQMEDQPRLIGGVHAEQQLQKAKRQIDEAQSKASTDDERRKLATARNVIGAAQQEIAAASGRTADMFVIHMRDSERPFVIETPTIADMHVDPKITTLKPFTIHIDPQMHVQVEKMMASAEIQKQLAEAKRIDRAEIDRMVNDARQQQEAAMAAWKSGKIQKQVEDARRQVEMAQRDMARLEMPGFPGSFGIPQAGEPLKVAASVLAGNSVSKVTPKYPVEMKEKKQQGEVLLHVLVNETGKVESANVISSPDETFSKSALEAVQQWTYKPVLLNGKPVAVESTVTVHYSFAQ